MDQEGAVGRERRSPSPCTPRKKRHAPALLPLPSVHSILGFSGRCALACFRRLHERMAAKKAIGRDFLEEGGFGGKEPRDHALLPRLFLAFLAFTSRLSTPYS